MDEADVLGDRFGAGYKLTMVKANKQPNLVIENYLRSHLGEVELLSEVSSEIVF